MRFFRFSPLVLLAAACLATPATPTVAATETTGQTAAAKETVPPSPTATGPIEDAPRPGEGAPMPVGHAFILGVVEGITEFLPISSTGHLILTNEVLDLDREVQARDLDGTPLWQDPPGSADAPQGNPLTVKEAADIYAIVIQAGAIAAVALLYWRTILGVLAGLFGRNPDGLRLLRNLLVAFFPAVILGLLFEDLIDTYLFSVETVIAALIVGAFIMLGVDRWQRRRAHALGERLPDPRLSELTVLQSLLIGLLQCVAMWPGMSRSMMTIVGGYIAGLRPARAAEFSFLLGLPTLAGAAVYKALGAGTLVPAAFGWGPLLLGCLVAAIAAAAAVRFLVTYLTRHGLGIFAWYRLALAAAVLLLL